MQRKKKYDVAISYASEDQAVAEELANAFKKKSLSVFYDKDYQDELWGKQLSDWFKKTFGKLSLFVLVLISRHYPVKDWTDFELSIAKAEENKLKREFILPVRLDNTNIAGIPRDKRYLDYNIEGASKIADLLFEKIKMLNLQKDPPAIFTESYKEWKMHEFLPGENKVRYFLDNLEKISLNIETCEFLLRSITGYHPDLKTKLRSIDNQILFNAAIKLLNKSETPFTKYHGIKYAIFANPNQAEDYIWNIYREESEKQFTQLEAFKRLWRCKSKKGLDESYKIVLTSPSWQFRQAALKNIGYGEIREETPDILAKALGDKRWEVRSEAAYAIVRLNLEILIPNMVNAYKNERSRKGGYRLLYCLWNYNDHPIVKSLMETYDYLPSWFGKIPDYHAIWDEMIDDL
jgi:hypothetical protein